MGRQRKYGSHIQCVLIRKIINIQGFTRNAKKLDGYEIKCVSIGKIHRKGKKIWIRDTMCINWPMLAKVVPGWVKLEGICWPEWLSSSSSSASSSVSASSSSAF